MCFEVNLNSNHSDYYQDPALNYNYEIEVSRQWRPRHCHSRCSLLEWPGVSPDFLMLDL